MGDLITRPPDEVKNENQKNKSHKCIIARKGRFSNMDNENSADHKSNMDYKSHRNNVVFISGKVSGDPDYLDKFNKAEKYYTSKGFRVINPANMFERVSWMSWGQIINMCLELIEQADILIQLPDWKDSTGACIEYGYARALDKLIDHFGGEIETDTDTETETDTAAGRVDRGKVKALRKAGWSAQKIADEMDISTGYVYKILKEEGIK